MRVNTYVVIFLMTFLNDFLVFILPIPRFKVAKSDASEKDSVFRTQKRTMISQFSRNKQRGSFNKTDK